MNNRNSNLELFRIISMFMILMSHYNTYITEKFIEDPFSIQSIYYMTMGAWGKTGINCFIMITGYFMCTSNVSVRKFFKLLFEIYFYRIIINLVFLMIGYQEISIKSFMFILLPIRSVTNNFVDCYMLFFLTIPFINILIRNMSQKQHFLLILLSLFIYTALPLLFIKVDFNYVIWFGVIYLIASFIRLYDRQFFHRKALWVGVFLLSIIIGSLSQPLIMLLNETFIIKYLGQPLRFHKFLCDSNAIIALLVGISSFMFFKEIRIKKNKYINLVGASTFGILLIHANSDVMRVWLWKDFTRTIENYYSPNFIFYHLTTCIFIFLICSLLDIFRIKIVEKPVLCWFDKWINKNK